MCHNTYKCKNIWNFLCNYKFQQFKEQNDIFVIGKKDLDIFVVKNCDSVTFIILNLL